MDIYTPIGVTGNNQNRNRWKRSLIRQLQTDTGHICSVRIDPNGEVAIQSQAEEVELKKKPYTVLGSTPDMEENVDVG